MFKKNSPSSILNETIGYLFLCAFFLFIGKWLSSYYFYDEELGIRIIFDSQGDSYFYFPYIKALSSLDFNNSFDSNILNLKNISLPLGAIFFHSIFFKIFGFNTFIFLEFVCILLFLVIFYLIFQKFRLSKLVSLILTLSIFILVLLIDQVKFDYISYLPRISEFYNLRFPRPLVVNLFFYSFILFLINLSNKEIYNNKNFIILGTILALSFTSFYYIFIIEVITFFLFLIYKYKFSINFLFKDKIKFYLISIFVFLFLSAPFLLNLYFVEPDYSERLCIIDLTLSRKIIIINHLLKGLIKLEFLIIFFLISFLIFYVNKKKIQNFELNNILYIIFLSSILSPFAFISISPKSCLVFHFNNYIIISSIICLFFLFITFFKNISDKYLINKKISKYFFLVIIVILISFYNFNIFYGYKSNYENKSYRDYRNHLNLTVKEINELKISKKDLSLATFDNRLMVWAIMNNVKDIKLISGQIVPKTHDMIENDIISFFKSLTLNENDFVNFFENKKSNWRYYNSKTQSFFWMRYSASSLKTHNDSKDFDADVLDFINNTSPLHVQSLAIPNNEFKRLKLKFKNFQNRSYKWPIIVAINKEEELFLNKNKLMELHYCLVNTSENYVIYKLKNKIVKCKH